MKQEFIDYELHLQMYNKAIEQYGMTYASYEVGKPEKPEGYDEYKALQNPENQVIKNTENSFSYVDFIKRLEIAEKEKEQNPEKGLLFDSEGIPQYLTADDHYNGIENPEWTKKHVKAELKPSPSKTNKNEKLGINYDEDGIPEYLTAEAYHFGEANPAWLKKHQPDLWLKLYGK